MEQDHKATSICGLFFSLLKRKERGKLVSMRGHRILIVHGINLKLFMFERRLFTA